MTRPEPTPTERFRKALRDLSLHGYQSRDEAHAMNLLAYYLTNTTAEKIIAAIKGDEA